MSRKKDKRAAVNSRSFKTEEDESIDSPFKNIVLKEKKEEPVKKKPQAVKKKPSEIVQGYDPGASFADILSNWERTGNPYALPHEKKKEASATKQASFGDILASWDRMNDPEAQRKKKEAKRVSPEYKPTKDFGALLDQYEGKVPQKTAEALPRRKEKDSVSRATFFRQMEEDDERPATVAWSVFGGNAEKKAEPEKKKETAAPVKKEKRVSKEYKPTKDFGALLDAFEGRKPAETKKEIEAIKSIPEERTASEDRKKETEVNMATFFREMEEDDERPATVAWSVFGDNKPIERPVKPEEPERKEPVQEKKPSPPPRVQPRKSRLFSESVKKMPEKTFEEILKEKGEMKKKPREKTLNELRIMLPMATLDLHGMGYTEAEGEVNRFLDEAVSSRIEKVAIIHGKGLHSADGEGVLRELVYSILEARGLVRELTVPKPQYGGSGAVWVILRKQTDEEPSA